MKDTPFARPYAIAVFEYASEHHSEAQWSQALFALSVLVESPQMAARVANPCEDKMLLAQTCIELTQEWMSDATRRFVRLLAYTHRLSLLPTMASLYESLLAESKEAMDVMVESAIPLSLPYQQKLTEQLKKRWKKEPVLHIKVNPLLLGGLRIRVGDTVIDGSTAFQLTTLKQKLIGELCN